MPDIHTSVHRPTGARAALRIGLVVACALYIWGAPFAGQVLGVREPVLRSWKMFAGVGVEVTQARYTQVRPDGTEAALDPVALGVAEAGRRGRFVDQEDARATASDLCGTLGAGADVRLVFRAASRQGWRTLDDGTANRCAAPKSTKKRKKKKDER